MAAFVPREGLNQEPGSVDEKIRIDDCNLDPACLDFSHFRDNAIPKTHARKSDERKPLS
jgi:hypothetical protein